MCYVCVSVCVRRRMVGAASRRQLLISCDLIRLEMIRLIWRTSMSKSNADKFYSACPNMCPICFAHTFGSARIAYGQCSHWWKCTQQTSQEHVRSCRTVIRWRSNPLMDLFVRFLHSTDSKRNNIVVYTLTPHRRLVHGWPTCVALRTALRRRRFLPLCC